VIFTDYNFNLDSIGTRKAHHDGEKGAGNPQDNFFVVVVFLCYGLYASMLIISSVQPLFWQET
jgi:hypothetical protein